MVSAICNFFISSICTIQNFGTSLLGFIKIEHGFIELMAGIEGAILALAIPLSHESVLKMSERYNSETVSALFQKKKTNNRLSLFVDNWDNFLLDIRFLL